MKNLEDTVSVKLDDILNNLKSDILQLQYAANEDQEKEAEKKLLTKEKPKKKSKKISKRKLNDAKISVQAPEIRLNNTWKKKKKDVPVLEVTSLKLEKVIKAIKLLKKPKEKVSSKQNFAKVCNYSYISNKVKGYSWNSPICVVEHITKSILTRNWDVLPDLLMLLMNFSYKSFNTYVKEMSLLMLLLHQHEFGEPVNTFLETFFFHVSSRKAKDRESSNFWFYNDLPEGV